MSLAATGMAKPRVLPDPVFPRPRMSRPASASGSVAAWIGNGAVMPAAASAATSGAGTPAPAKEPTRGAGEELACGAASLAWRRLPRGADRRSVDRADKEKPPEKMPRFHKPPRPWKPARLSAAYDRRAGTAAPECGWPRRAIVKVAWRFRGWLAHGRAPSGGEQPAKAAGGRGDDGRVGKRLPAENEQQGPGGLDQSRLAVARVGLRQCAQGLGEPAARVRVTPGVGAGEKGGDGRVQLAAVGAGSGLRLGGQRRRGRCRRAGLAAGHRGPHR